MACHTGRRETFYTRNQRPVSPARSGNISAPRLTAPCSHTVPLSNGLHSDCAGLTSPRSPGDRHYVNFVIENNIPKAISKEEIIVSTGNDKELQKLIKCV